MRKMTTPSIFSSAHHILVLFLPILSLLLNLPTRGEAAHARKRPTATTPSSPSSSNYDKSITTFSDDGRLLQVEYGIKASNRGGCVACASFEFEGKGRVVVLATASEIALELELELDNQHKKQHENDPPRKTFAIPPVIRHSQKVHRIDTNLLLITTGLNGDGRALANMMRRVALDHRLRCGEAEMVPSLNGGFASSSCAAMGGPMAIQAAARECAFIQHELTRMGGARPLGVCATLVGTDPYDSSRGVGLFQSDPGGAVEEYEFCAAGMGADSTQKKLGELVRMLKENGEVKVEDSSSDNHGEDFIMKKLVQGVATIALETCNETSETKSVANKSKIDVYILQSNPRRRGGFQIQTAKFIDKNDLEQLGSLILSRA